MREDEPRDPSLAMCRICANAGEVKIYAPAMNGKLTIVRTCSRIVCNDFVPGNIGGWKL